MSGILTREQIYGHLDITNDPDELEVWIEAWANDHEEEPEFLDEEFDEDDDEPDKYRNVDRFPPNIRPGFEKGS